MRPAKIVIDPQLQIRHSRLIINKHAGFQRSRGRDQRLTGSGTLANGAQNLGFDDSVLHTNRFVL